MIHIENYSSLFAFSIGIISVLVIVIFLFPQQVIETTRPKDGLSSLRRIILAILLVSIISAIPSILYQYYRMIGQEYEVFRNISTVTSQISKIANLILLVMVFKYRVKDEE